MRVRFFNIDWDTTDEDREMAPSDLECGLPTECVLDVDDDLDVANEGADVLSDKHGFCVNSFEFEKLPNEDAVAQELGTTTLKDVMGGFEGEQKVTVSVEKDGLALIVHPEGFGTYDGDYAPILLERHEGRLRVIVWPDINDQEPVIIDIEGARQTNFKGVQE